MRLLIVILFASSVVINGCSDIEPKIQRAIPENLVQKPEMVEILYDIQLIQAAYKGRSHNDTLAEQKRDARSLALLESHNLSQGEFEASLAYYHKFPDDMEELYGEVITKMNTKIAQLEEKID